MNTKYKDLEKKLLQEQSIWLVTGCAGFIGSHLVERLLKLNQKVVGIDNFSTGKRENLDYLLAVSNDEQKNNFTFFEADICDLDIVDILVQQVDYILHQAAIGSVPRSILDPLTSHKSNVDGFCNILVSGSKNRKLKKIVFASSSSVYGDDDSAEKSEEKVGQLLSPYALTKKTNENYADVFARTFSMNIVALRYFNVFGPRQDPNGQYAAVIPKWIDLLLRSKEIEVYGDGSTSRDFCYIENVVQANLLAATVHLEKSFEVFNIALNASTSLNTLLKYLSSICNKMQDDILVKYSEFRNGDIRNSCANIERAKQFLGYAPSIYIQEGLAETVKAFRN